MIMYGSLDQYGEKIRDWAEIKRISNAFNKYKATNNVEYIEVHLKHWVELKDLLDDENARIESLAIEYWDLLHPLSEEDEKRWHKIHRQKILHLLPL